ncbi:hypothetical protein RhiirB3_440610 [Rhizophagus irregularis]|nr:hypothetical protein RhiirB3_440610 [Rhizophagus irregularis]
MSQNNNIELKEPERNREQQLLLIIKVLKVLDKLPEGLFHEKVIFLEEKLPSLQSDRSNDTKSRELEEKLETEEIEKYKEKITNLENQAEVKLITGTRKEEGNGHEFISHKNRKNSNTQDHPNGKINEIPIDVTIVTNG